MIYNIGRLLVFLFCKIFLLARFQGVENIPKSGPVLICANHRSNFDPPLVGGPVSRKIRSMAKEELFKVPVLGSMIRHVGAFPIKRGTADGVAVKKAIDILQSGGILLMFPQGTRKKELNLKDFKRGAAAIARRGGAVIVPVGIKGSYKLFGRPVVRYGKPVSIGQDDDDGKITELIYAKIKELTE